MTRCPPPRGKKVIQSRKKCDIVFCFFLNRLFNNVSGGTHTQVCVRAYMAVVKSLHTFIMGMDIVVFLTVKHIFNEFKLFILFNLGLVVVLFIFIFSVMSRV